MKKRVGTVDLNSGQILEGTFVWVGNKLRSPYGSRWYMSSQDAAIELAKDKDMTKESLRVFMYLVGHLDFENFINIPQVTIAEELELKKQNVNRAIKILHLKGVIIKGPKVLRSSTFRLNEKFGWKGKVKNLKLAYSKEENNK